jgi:hypothetical protein
MAGHGITCPCRSCCNKFEAKGLSWDPDKRRYVKRGGGGTMNSSAFRTNKPTRPDGKRDHYFNGPGDGSNKGHVVEGAQRGTYHYARDVEGNVYIDDKKL